MLKSYYTEICLGIKDAILDEVKEVNFTKHFYIHMEKRIHKCPDCGSSTSKVHDYRVQEVKDIPSFGLKSVLHLRKRRHVCPYCGKKFYETVPFLPKYQRTTNRLWVFILSQLSKSTSMKYIANEVGVSSPTVARVLNAVNYSLTSLPSILSIDEFRGNANGEKFQCILTNPKTKKVLDILPNRKQEDLCKYFSKFENRKNVKYISMDMSNTFRSTMKICFPNATIVADKFHVVRQVSWAFENVRKDVQKAFAKGRRRYFKRSRQLLLKRPETLTPDQLEQVSIMLSLSKRLAVAYHLKNEFYRLMDSADKNEARKRLSNWYLLAGVANQKEFNKCIDTFNNWQSEILAAFDTGITNGFTEGCNNRIKVIKRTAYGLRNFDTFRNRILHSMSH